MPHTDRSSSASATDMMNEEDDNYAPQDSDGATGNQVAGSTQDQLQLKRQRGLEAQRAFRKRKAAHVQDLEKKVAAFEVENAQLRGENGRLKEENDWLRKRLLDNSTAPAGQAVGYRDDRFSAHVTAGSSAPRRTATSPPTKRHRHSMDEEEQQHSALLHADHDAIGSDLPRSRSSNAEASHRSSAPHDAPSHSRRPPPRAQTLPSIGDWSSHPEYMQPQYYLPQSYAAPSHNQRYAHHPGYRQAEYYQQHPYAQDPQYRRVSPSPVHRQHGDSHVRDTRGHYGRHGTATSVPSHAPATAGDPRFVQHHAPQSQGHLHPQARAGPSQQRTFDVDRDYEVTHSAPLSRNPSQAGSILLSPARICDSPPLAEAALPVSAPATHSHESHAASRTRPYPPRQSQVRSQQSASNAPAGAVPSLSYSQPSSFDTMDTSSSVMTPPTVNLSISTDQEKNGTAPSLTEDICCNGRIECPDVQAGHKELPSLADLIPGNGTLSADDGDVRMRDSDSVTPVASRDAQQHQILAGPR